MNAIEIRTCMLDNILEEVRKQFGYNYDTDNITKHIRIENCSERNDQLYGDITVLDGLDKEIYDYIVYIVTGKQTIPKIIDIYVACTYCDKSYGSEECKSCTPTNRITLYNSRKEILHT